MAIVTPGMDLGKIVLAVHGLDKSGKPSVAVIDVALTPRALMDSGVGGVRFLSLPDTGVFSEVPLLWNRHRMAIAERFIATVRNALLSIGALLCVTSLRQAPYAVNTDLYGGLWVTSVPTATDIQAEIPSDESRWPTVTRRGEFRVALTKNE